MDGFTPSALQNLSEIAAVMLGLIVIARLALSGFQTFATLQEKSFAAAADAVKQAVEAMTRTQAQSREYYVGKLEDMRAGMKILEERIDDLEEEVKDKDKRIEELERENGRLHRELDALEVRINNSKGHKTRGKKATP